METWLAILGLLLMIGLSLWARVRRLRQAENDIQAEVKSSPLSMAVQELVSVAGGIYLSLVTLISFLKLNVPERITICGVSADPLACGAIGMAILQPLIISLFIKTR